MVKYLPSLCRALGCILTAEVTLPIRQSIYMSICFLSSTQYCFLRKQLFSLLQYWRLTMVRQVNYHWIPSPTLRGKKKPLILNHEYQDNSASVSLISWSQFRNLKNVLLPSSHPRRELSPLKVPSPQSAFLSKDILGQKKRPTLPSAGVPGVWFFFWVDVISVTQATGYVWREAELATCGRSSQFRLLFAGDGHQMQLSSCRWEHGVCRNQSAS